MLRVSRRFFMCISFWNLFFLQFSCLHHHDHDHQHHHQHTLAIHSVSNPITISVNAFFMYVFFMKLGNKRTTNEYSPNLKQETNLFNNGLIFNQFSQSKCSSCYIFIPFIFIPYPYPYHHSHTITIQYSIILFRFRFRFRFQYTMDVMR